MQFEAQLCKKINEVCNDVSAFGSNIDFVSLQVKAHHLNAIADFKHRFDQVVASKVS
jgi:hypothetical protein